MVDVLGVLLLQGHNALLPTQLSMGLDHTDTPVGDYWIEKARDIHLVPCLEEY